MNIKDLDFQELLQKPVELPFFVRHFEGELFNQELETVVGGLQPVKSEGGGSELTLPTKIIAKPVVRQSVLVNGSTTTKILGGLTGIVNIVFDFCIPDELHPPYYICFYE